jgi:hypothetical protein
MHRKLKGKAQDSSFLLCLQSKFNIQKWQTFISLHELNLG